MVNPLLININIVFVDYELNKPDDTKDNSYNESEDELSELNIYEKIQVLIFESHFNYIDNKDYNKINIDIIDNKGKTKPITIPKPNK